jgi:mono/diheme cytochrome c family protein
MFAATPVQQSVAYVVAGIVAVGFILWLLANSRRARPEVGSEIELAANRKPYYGDEEMEGKRLDRAQWLGLAFLLVIAIGLPLYWLAEPGRQAGAINNFKKVFASRGEELSVPTAQGGFNCQGCHGGVSGAPVQYNLVDPITSKITPVMWQAPSLDDVTLRMTDDQLREVLTYGRPFSPMPAWGLEGGGPMNEQQIDNLIAWLHSVAIKPDEARKRNTDNAATELATLQDPQTALATAQAAVAKLDADPATVEADLLKAQAQVTLLQGIIATGQEASEGAALFNVNCARCHTLGWSYNMPTEPGSGAFGPPLSNVLNQFPNIEDHVDFVTEGKEFGEKYGRQGKASGRMPHFGTVLTSKQIKAIVCYERELVAKKRGESLGKDCL